MFLLVGLDAKPPATLERLVRIDKKMEDKKMEDKKMKDKKMKDRKMKEWG